jgi:hypothetical protein
VVQKWSFAAAGEAKTNTPSTTCAKRNQNSTRSSVRAMLRGVATSAGKC